MIEREAQAVMNKTQDNVTGSIQNETQVHHESQVNPEGTEDMQQMMSQDDLKSSAHGTHYSKHSAANPF